MRTIYLSRTKHQCLQYTLEELQQLPFMQYSQVTLPQLLLQIKIDKPLVLQHVLAQVLNYQQSQLEDAIVSNSALQASLNQFVSRVSELKDLACAPFVLSFIEKLAYKRLIKVLQLNTQQFLFQLQYFIPKYYASLAIIFQQLLFQRQNLQDYFLSIFGNYLLEQLKNPANESETTASFKIAAVLQDRKTQVLVTELAVNFLAQYPHSQACEQALEFLAQTKCNTSFTALGGQFLIFYELWPELTLRCYENISAIAPAQFCLKQFIDSVILLVEGGEEAAAEILRNISGDPASSFYRLNTDILEVKSRKSQAVLIEALCNFYDSNAFQPDIDDLQQLLAKAQAFLLARYANGVDAAFQLLAAIAQRDGAQLLQEFGVGELALACQNAFGDGEWGVFLVLDAE